MRRVLGLVGLIAVGVLAGFVIRLVLPRRERLTFENYVVTPTQGG